MPLKFTESERGGKILIYEGYMYSKKSVNVKNITWRCYEHRRLSCSVIIHTTSDKRTGKIDGVVPTHSHAIDVAEVAATKVKENLKKKAARGNANNSATISSVLAKVSSPVKARLPAIKSLTRTVQRVRNDKAEVVNPKSLDDLIISDVHKFTDGGNLFLLHDSNAGSERFLIYATQQNLSTLAECQLWCCDGTFNSVPLIFKQLYTIHGMYRDKLLPLVYMLAPNKSQTMYNSALSVIKNHEPNLKPQRILIDFEIAFMNAAKKQFPNCVIYGCLFHYSQCIWRHVQTCGLQVQYNTDILYSLNIKKLMALAFVPINDVVSAYEELIKTQFFEDHDEVLNELLQYFERTWIGVLRRSGNGRKKPIYSIEMWNCHKAVIDDEMRSNNGVEGWHRKFNNNVRVAHEVFSAFVNVLKSEQIITETNITQMDTGRDVAVKRRKVYIDQDKRIKSIVSNYDPDQKMNFLKIIAQVVSIK